jgi:hypothetical protein
MLSNKFMDKQVTTQDEGTEKAKPQHENILQKSHASHRRY